MKFKVSHELIKKTKSGNLFSKKIGFEFNTSESFIKLLRWLKSYFIS